jgi:hypothetical protein
VEIIDDVLEPGRIVEVRARARRRQSVGSIGSGTPRNRRYRPLRFRGGRSREMRSTAPQRWNRAVSPSVPPACDETLAEGVNVNTAMSPSAFSRSRTRFLMAERPRSRCAERLPERASSLFLDRRRLPRPIARVRRGRELAATYRRVDRFRESCPSAFPLPPPQGSYGWGHVTARHSPVSPPSTATGSTRLARIRREIPRPGRRSKPSRLRTRLTRPRRARR